MLDACLSVYDLKDFVCVVCNCLPALLCNTGLTEARATLEFSAEPQSSPKSGCFSLHFLFLLPVVEKDLSPCPIARGSCSGHPLPMFWKCPFQSYRAGSHTLIQCLDTQSFTSEGCMKCPLVQDGEWRSMPLYSGVARLVCLLCVQWQRSRY